MKKYQIFISSTYTDLVNERLRVTESILEMNHFPIGMEMFSAADENQWSIIKRTIDLSDYYVLIIGHRYGSLTEENISYTEKEFNYAREKGIPILAFIRNRDVATKPTERESDPEKQQKLDIFIEKAMNSRMCSFWNSTEDLVNQISIALMKQFQENPQKGWIRAEEKSLRNELRKIQKNISLEDCIRKYLEDKKRRGLEEVTIQSYKNELQLFKDFVSNEYIYNIDHLFIKRYLKHRQDNFNITKKITLERIRSELKVFFEWLIEEQIIEVNPVNKIAPYKVEQADIKPLKDFEIRELKINCETLRERAVLEIFLATGCKLSELINLKRENIDTEKNIILISNPRGNDRVIPLNRDVVFHIRKYLETRLDDLEFLFVTERKPFRQLNSRTVQDIIKKILQRTSLKRNVSPRTFRMTFAQNMLKKGYSKNIVQSLLGYRDYSSSSETYVKITSDNYEEILNKQ